VRVRGEFVNSRTAWRDILESYDNSPFSLFSATSRKIRDSSADGIGLSRFACQFA
jgi:hypothetical protein